MVQVWHPASLFAGHVIYLDIVHKKYGCQVFLLNVSHNVTNKREPFISFSASKVL